MASSLPQCCSNRAIGGSGHLLFRSASSSCVSLGQGNGSQRCGGGWGAGADVLQDPIHVSTAQRDPPWLPCPRGSPIQWRPRTPLLPLEPCICATMTLFILSFHMRVLSRQNMSPLGQHAWLTVSGSRGSVPGNGAGHTADSRQYGIYGEARADRSVNQSPAACLCKYSLWGRSHAQRLLSCLQPCSCSKGSRT